MLRHLPVLLLLSGCAARILPAPPPVADTWSVDRDALPYVTMRAKHVAMIHFRERMALDGGGRQEFTAPVTVYVLEHPDQGLLLIDAGFGRRTVADPKDLPGKLMTNLLDLEMGTPIADALADMGKAPEDVKHVFLTHLHTDHAAGVEDLPEAQIWTNEPGWEHAQKRRLVHAMDPRAYEGRTPVFFEDQGKLGPFPSHHDLFGDGSIIALPTPGHTAGHTSFLVNLREGSWLLTGDASWFAAGWQGPTAKGWLARGLLEQDWKQNHDSLWRIKRFAEAHDDVRVVAGHEPSSVQDLPFWPDLLPGSGERPPVVEEAPLEDLPAP